MILSEVMEKLFKRLWSSDYRIISRITYSFRFDVAVVPKQS